MRKCLFGSVFCRTMEPTYTGRIAYYNVAKGGKHGKKSIGNGACGAAAGRYGTEIEAVVAKSIYLFDMYPGTGCKAAESDRTASLGDENYIVANKTGDRVTFGKPRKCAFAE